MFGLGSDFSAPRQASRCSSRRLHVLVAGKHVQTLAGHPSGERNARIGSLALLFNKRTYVQTYRFNAKTSFSLLL